MILREIQDKLRPALAILGAAAVGAVVLLRPVAPPTVAATAWSSADPAGRHGGRTPPPRALVYVAGEVVRPGVYSVGPDARARDALALAGGAKPGADPVAVNLAAHVRDGDEIVVAARGAQPLAAASKGRAHAHGRGGGPRRAGRHKRSRRDEPPPGGEIDLNTADAATLATVPGIGGGLAERIIAFRSANGPFASVDELLDVSGITDRRLDAIVPFVVAR